MRTPERYDIIIADATHPGTADSWVLYTEEFYQLCRQRLKKEGFIAQWIPLHGLAVADYEMLLRTFRAVFPHATLWLTDKYSIVLGANQPQHIDFELLTQRLSAAAVQESLQEVDLADPVSFTGTLALDERAFSDYAGHGPLNTDDRPYISFTDRRRGDTGAGLPALSRPVAPLGSGGERVSFRRGRREETKHRAPPPISQALDRGRGVSAKRQNRRRDLALQTGPQNRSGRKNGPAGTEKVRRSRLAVKKIMRSLY